MFYSLVFMFVIAVIIFCSVMILSKSKTYEDDLEYFKKSGKTYPIKDFVLSSKNVFDNVINLQNNNYKS